MSVSLIPSQSSPNCLFVLPLPFWVVSHLPLLASILSYASLLLSSYLFYHLVSFYSLLRFTDFPSVLLLPRLIPLLRSPRCPSDLLRRSHSLTSLKGDRTSCCSVSRRDRVPQTLCPVSREYVNKPVLQHYSCCCTTHKFFFLLFTP